MLQTNFGDHPSISSVEEESSPLFEEVTSLYMYTKAEKIRGDHCVKMVK
jgi:hypothetical protein